MEKKTLLRLIVILLGLFWVVYAVAVPATRSSKMGKMDSSSVVQDQLIKEELFYNFNMEGGDDELEGRMMLEIIADYPGTRANPAHDPKSPGKP